MEDALKEYMNRYNQIEDEFQSIRKICRCLNREIQAHEIGRDDIRNRADAYNWIIEWNAQIDKQLSKTFPAAPPVDFFKVIFKPELGETL